LSAGLTIVLFIVGILAFVAPLVVVIRAYRWSIRWLRRTLPSLVA